MFFISDYITVEPGEDGVSVVTAKVPSFMVTEILDLVKDLEHVSRVLRTKTRAAEAIYAARKHKTIS